MEEATISCKQNKEPTSRNQQPAEHVMKSDLKRNGCTPIHNDHTSLKLHCHHLAQKMPNNGMWATSLAVSTSLDEDWHKLAPTKTYGYGAARDSGKANAG